MTKISNVLANCCTDFLDSVVDFAPYSLTPLFKDLNGSRPKDLFSFKLFRYGDVLPRETGTCVSVRRFASITVQQRQLKIEPIVCCLQDPVQTTFRRSIFCRFG
jgi:hypothetical protein